MSAALHERLGLMPPRRLRTIWADPPEGWHDLGTANVAPNDDGHVWATVRVEVTYTPATFWRFTIAPCVEDVHAIVLETGSGDLADFWPAVELFATGMLVAS